MKPDQIADVLEGACDVLLVRGRSVHYHAEDGVCIIKAVGEATRTLFGVFDLDEHGDFLRDSVRVAALLAIQARAGGNIVAFNYRATDDEAFDLLRSAAKELREVAA